MWSSHVPKGASIPNQVMDSGTRRLMICALASGLGVNSGARVPKMGSRLGDNAQFLSTQDLSVIIYKRDTYLSSVKDFKRIKWSHEYL